MSQDQLNSDQIRAIITRIVEYRCSGDKKTELKKEQPYSDFAVSHPRLFDMACSPDFDWTKLNAMLALLDQIHGGSMSQNKASEIVGQALFDIYVQPKLKDAKKKDEM